MAYGNRNSGPNVKTDRFGNPYVTTIVKKGKESNSGKIGNPYFYFEAPGGALYKIDFNIETEWEFKKENEIGFARITKMKKREQGKW